MNYDSLDKVLFYYYGDNKLHNQIAYYKNNKDAINALISFGFISGDKNMADFFLTEKGMDICKKGGLVKEQENIERHDDFVKSSLILSKSTKRAQIIAIIVSVITLVALVAQILVSALYKE